MKRQRKTYVKKTKVGDKELFFDILKERAETGRIYIMNIDHANDHSSFKDRILMSNMLEITLLLTHYNILMAKVKLHCVFYLQSMLVR